MKKALVAQILDLPVAERMRLVEVIWDSISAAPESLPLARRQRDELDRRLAEYEADPSSGSSLEEVFARVRTSLWRASSCFASGRSISLLYTRTFSSDNFG